jgi:membrane associated rhomboid family serine protease
MIALVVCFALQNICWAYFSKSFVRDYLELSLGGLRKGFVWQVFTFQFLHGGLFHLLFNLLGVWFFGRVVEHRLGTRGFLQLYFLAGIAGGLFQVSYDWITRTPLEISVVGASAGVLALLAAFALLEPNAQILIMFVLPVRARYILWAELAISAFFVIVPTSPGIAHAAHLGGILTAIAYMRWDASRVTVSWNPLEGRRRKRQLVQAAAQVAKWRSRREPPGAGEVPPEEFISKEVDPILDKISAHGIHSLTQREREILEAARARMSKR